MIRSTLHAVFLRRYDRWEWLVWLVLLALLVVYDGWRPLIAVTGVTLGLHTARAIKAWGETN